MKDEIKEIYLINLEWNKTHDNMGGVMGNIVFKDNMSYEEYQKLFKTIYFVLCDKDYITNLQTIEQQYSAVLSENAELENKITNLQEKLEVSQTNEETYRLEMEDITKCLGLKEDTIFDEVKEYSTNLQEENERLNNIIEKTINILELSAQNKGICSCIETDTIQSALKELKERK